MEHGDNVYQIKELGILFLTLFFFFFFFFDKSHLHDNVSKKKKHLVYIDFGRIQKMWGLNWLILFHLQLSNI